MIQEGFNKFEAKPIKDDKLEEINHKLFSLESKVDNSSSIFVGNTTVISTLEKIERKKKKTMNLRIVGIKEKDNNNFITYIPKFFRDKMEVLEQPIVKAYFIGRKGDKPRHIIVKIWNNYKI